MKSFRALIKESLGIYRKKIGSILVLLMVFVVITIIFGLSLGVCVGIGISPPGHVGIPMVLFFIGIVLLMIIFFIFTELSFLILIARPVEIKLRRIFKEAWEKLWQCLWIMILLTIDLFIIFFSFFLTIPCLIIAIYLIFCFYVFITEGEKGTNVLKRSWALVKGNWWKIFGKLFLLGIVFDMIYILLSSVNNLLSIVFQFFYTPFGIIFLYLIYLELKKSKEIQAPTPIQVQESI